MSEDASLDVDQILLSAEAKSFTDIQFALRDAHETRPTLLLALLSDIAGLSVSNDKDGQVFSTGWPISHGSWGSNRLSEVDVETLQLAAPSISNLKLRGRLFDILSSRLEGAPRVEAAREAISAYERSSGDITEWLRDGSARRTLDLAKRYGGATRDDLMRIRKDILAAILNLSRVDDSLNTSLRAAQLIRDSRLISSDDSEPIFDALKAGAESLTSNPYLARQLFYEASLWARSLPASRTDEEWICLALMAGQWEHEARARLTGESPSHLVAASHFESAFQVLRNIPRRVRVQLGIDERLNQLVVAIQEHNEAASDEMSTFVSEPIDLNEMARDAKEGVAGRDLIEALRRFVGRRNLSDPDDSKKASEELIAKYPLASLFSHTQFTRDHRVSAKSGQEEAVWRQMVQTEVLGFNLWTKGYILPALEQLRIDHHIHYQDFETLASESSIVPRGREQLFGAGLASGFALDFQTALYLLVPQVEYLVRAHLKAAQVQTTRFDQDGVESEASLGTLLELEEAATIFGAALVFELRVLLLGPFGLNLRNDAAHGLLDDRESSTAAVVYFWWLVLRMVFMPFWNEHHERPDESEPETPDNS